MYRCWKEGKHWKSIFNIHVFPLTYLAGINYYSKLFQPRVTDLILSSTLTSKNTYSFPSMHFFHRDYLIADRFVSERRRGRSESKGTSVGGVQTPRQDRSLFAVYNKIRSKTGSPANILMQTAAWWIDRKKRN